MPLWATFAASRASMVATMPALPRSLLWFDAVEHRCRDCDRLEPAGELGDRKEGAGEEEHGNDDETEEQGESGGILEPRGERRGRSRHPEAHEQRRPDGEQRLEQRGNSEGGHHCCEHDRDHEHACSGPQHVPGDEPAYPDRGCESGVIGLDPLDTGHHLPRAFARAGLHGGGDEEAGRQEREVGNAVDASGDVLVDERAEAHAHGREVENRIEERRDDRSAPGSAIDPGLGFEDAQGEGCGHQSTSVRPVRRRNTSSREDRLARIVSGARPASAIREIVCSASSV